MTGPRAHAGWYPDPADQRVLRYWDGTGWTRLTAAPSQPSLLDQSANGESQPDEPEPVVGERKTAVWAIVGVGVLIALAFIGIVLATQSRDPAAPFGVQPDREQRVVELIQEARQEYDDANHDLQRDAALAKRDQGICRELDKSDGHVENWTGQIHEIESNHDGEGILGINIEPDTQVTTRFNAFSNEDTVIPPGRLLDQVTELEVGQVVSFSGQFIADDDDGPCFTNPRITQRQEIARPLMVFKFSDVGK